MAPGPYVEILDDKPTSFEDAKPPKSDEFDGDEDFTTYRYYRSRKILGRLFDAIDEREVFQRVQQTRLEHSFYKTTGESNTPNSILEDIWNFIQSHHQVPYTWTKHLDRARGIRDE